MWNHQMVSQTLLVTSTPISELKFSLVFHFTMFPPTLPHDSTCHPHSTHDLLIRLIDGSAGNISCGIP